MEADVSEQQKSHASVLLCLRHNHRHTPPPHVRQTGGYRSGASIPDHQAPLFTLYSTLQYFRCIHTVQPHKSSPDLSTTPTNPID
jgi:hypothetical protein